MIITKDFIHKLYMALIFPSTDLKYYGSYEYWRSYDYRNLALEYL
jgi:hypothetical protein